MRIDCSDGRPFEYKGVEKLSLINVGSTVGPTERTGALYVNVSHVMAVQTFPEGEESAE